MDTFFKIAVILASVVAIDRLTKIGKELEDIRRQQLKNQTDKGKEND